MIDIAEQPDWNLSGSPPIIDGKFQVWLDDGSVRECCGDTRSMVGGLYFTDCTHPMQNAHCARSIIKAWRLA